jgi:hypothetical protein
MVSVFMRADVSAVSLDWRMEQWLNSKSDGSIWSGAIALALALALALVLASALEVRYEFANSQ